MKIANFSPLRCLAIPRRDLSTKKTKADIDKRPEGLAVMLEFKYIERSHWQKMGLPLICVNLIML